MLNKKKLLIISLIATLLLGLTYPFNFVASPHTLKGEIPIGVVISATVDAGQIIPMGKIAEEEINEFLKLAGVPAKIKFLYEDAEGSPAKALEKVQSLYARGVKVILCISWSSQVKAVMGYANAHHILIFSCGSTSPLLAIPDDFVFRLVPDDTKQGKALARALTSKGIKAVVVIQVGDAWGDGLYKAFSERYKELGGVIYDRIRFSPEATEFSAEVSRAATKIKEAISKYGKDKVAIELMCMADHATIIQLEAKNYPILLEVPWFGSDGYCMTTPILKQAGKYAAKVKHICPWYSFSRTSKYLRLREKFVKATGYDVQNFAVTFYDTAWITVLSMLIVGKYDADAIKSVLLKVADMYFGATGWTKLNEAGDRAGGDYDLYEIVEEDGTYKWKIVGHYSCVTDSVTWYREP